MNRLEPRLDPGRLRPAPLHDHHRREVRAVNSPILVLHAAQRDRVARLHAEAAVARLVRRSPERRLRRALGRSIVRLGERLASEPAELVSPTRS